MASRREFIRKMFAASAGMAWLGDRFFSGAGSAFAAAGVKESPGSKSGSLLKDMNPRDVDVKGLEITPLKDFGTMGLDDQDIDPNFWHLTVDGSIREPMKLTYAEVQAAPSVERAVLLICPGVFANYGLWRGISLSRLLKQAGMSSKANFVTFRGPEGRYEKVMRVPVEDALSEKVFLAYSVNGSPLPMRHGFPLRLVAEGYYGYDWVKYVHRVSAEEIET